MSDRALIIAALIVSGAIFTTSIQTRPRYSLSTADSNVAWRMDTWSGQIDICAAAYPPNGPVVRCGALVVTPNPQNAAPSTTSPEQDMQERPPAATLDAPRDRIDVGTEHSL